MEERAFDSALFDAMSTSELRLQEMGRDARTVVREHFARHGLPNKLLLDDLSSPHSPEGKSF